MDRVEGNGRVLVEALLEFLEQTESVDYYPASENPADHLPGRLCWCRPAALGVILHNSLSRPWPQRRYT